MRQPWQHLISEFQMVIKTLARVADIKRRHKHPENILPSINIMYLFQREISVYQKNDTHLLSRAIFFSTALGQSDTHTQSECQV